MQRLEYKVYEAAIEPYLQRRSPLLRFMISVNALVIARMEGIYKPPVHLEPFDMVLVSDAYGIPDIQQVLAANVYLKLHGV
jgi:hypothetical protein